MSVCHRGKHSTSTVIKPHHASQSGSNSSFQAAGMGRAFLTYWSDVCNENTILFQQNVNPCWTWQNRTQNLTISAVRLQRFCSFIMMEILVIAFFET